MTLLNDVKVANRITTNDMGIESELDDLIDAARTDLIITGVSVEKANDELDPLIKRAIILYTKAHFGYQNEDAERLDMTYRLLRDKLSMDIDYHNEVV